MLVKDSRPRWRSCSTFESLYSSRSRIIVPLSVEASAASSARYDPTTAGSSPQIARISSRANMQSIRVTVEG